MVAVGQCRWIRGGEFLSSGTSNNFNSKDSISGGQNVWSKDVSFICRQNNDQSQPYSSQDELVSSDAMFVLVLNRRCLSEACPSNYSLLWLEAESFMKSGNFLRFNEGDDSRMISSVGGLSLDMGWCSRRTKYFGHLVSGHTWWLRAGLCCEDWDMASCHFGLAEWHSPRPGCTSSIHLRNLMIGTRSVFVFYVLEDFLNSVGRSNSQCAPIVRAGRTKYNSR